MSLSIGKEEPYAIPDPISKPVKTDDLAAANYGGGGIDLASIMVGIITLGIIAGVIAATVFAVIPWAQKNAEQQKSIDTSCSVQSTPNGC